MLPRDADDGLFPCTRSISAWRLQIALELGKRRRDVWLDFIERRRIVEQLEQLGRLDVPDFGLLHFSNETGERLAVVRCAYVSHQIFAVGELS